MTTNRLVNGRLKLRHLLLVDALTEHGSVVGAAAELHVTQPVVTRALQELESILGVGLFERVPRGVVPTEFGVAFTEHARSVLAQLDQAERHLQEIADVTRGHVVVGTHLAGSNLLLPRAIAHLKGERPLVTVTVVERMPDALLVELLAGRVDVVVGRLGGPAAEGTVRHTLSEEWVRIVAGAHHPVAAAKHLTLQDLAEYPWILPGSTTRLRAELEAYFARQGFSLPPNRVEATSFLTVRQLLIETDMVAALPGSIGADDPRLVALPIPMDPIGHHVGLTLAADRRLTPATQALVASMRAVADPGRQP